MTKAACYINYCLDLPGDTKRQLYRACSLLHARAPSAYSSSITNAPLCVVCRLPFLSSTSTSTTCPSNSLPPFKPIRPTYAVPFFHAPFFGALTIPQVRAVVAPSDDLILSASRDSTAISWIKPSGSSFSPAYTFRASSRFVNSVAYLKPTTEAPQGESVYTLASLQVSLTAVLRLGYIVTGGQDSIINVWAIGTSQEEPLYTLLGHSDNVCALHVGLDGTIISGSWDKCVPLPPLPSSPS